MHYQRASIRGHHRGARQQHPRRAAPAARPPRLPYAPRAAGRRPRRPSPGHPPARWQQGGCPPAVLARRQGHAHPGGGRPAGGGRCAAGLHGQRWRRRRHCPPQHAQPCRAGGCWQARPVGRCAARGRRQAAGRGVGPRVAREPRTQARRRWWRWRRGVCSWRMGRRERWHASGTAVAAILIASGGKLSI